MTLKIRHIDGAAVMSDIESIISGTETEYIVPEIDYEYKYFTRNCIDGCPMVSKDCKEWVVPLSVAFNGTTWNPFDLEA